jgi:hypothetical protein
LQRSIGNQAVQELVRQGRLPPGPLGAENHALGNQAIQRLARPVQRNGGGGAVATAPAIPDAPQKTTGTPPPWASDAARETYRQTWVVGEVSYIVSSGHGYRAEHKPGGPDVTAVGTMNEIERAILADISSIVASLDVGKTGERPVSVNGQTVHYRYKKFAAKSVGIGTYFLPG